MFKEKFSELITLPLVVSFQAQDRIGKLQDIYCKYLLSYDLLPQVSLFVCTWLYSVHPNISMISPYFSLFITYDTDQEKLLSSQGLFERLIIPFILVILTFDPVVIIYREIRC